MDELPTLLEIFEVLQYSTHDLLRPRIQRFEEGLLKSGKAKIEKLRLENKPPYNQKNIYCTKIKSRTEFF